MTNRAGMTEAVAKALSQELERGREYPGFEYLTDDEAADIAVRALSPWLPTPEEAEVALAAVGNYAVRYPGDEELASVLAKLRRLAGEQDG